MALRPVALLLASLAFAAPLYSQGVSAQSGVNTPADAAASVAALIAQYPQCGAELTAAVATLIATQPDDAAAVIAAAQSASPACGSALAAGLAQGAALLMATNPAAAAAIRAAVWQSGNANFATAFALAYAAALAENPIALADQRAQNPQEWCQSASSPFFCSRIPRGPVVSPN